MNGAEISILVTAKDNASKVLQGVQKEANGLQKTLGTGLKFAALGAAAGVGAAGFALADFVKKAAAEQVGIQRLNTAIETLDEAHRGAAAGVEEVVRASEKLAFQDDEVRASLAKLIPATGDYDEAVRRLSVAQDLARGTGMDLETASKLVGKVNEENIQVLKRYGITLTDASTEQEALAAIQAKFAGQSEAYAETSAAKWEIFNNQIDNIKESIGGALLPTITKLGEALGDFLLKHQPAIDRFSVSLSEKIPAALEAIGKAIEPYLPTLKAFGDDVLKGWQTILTTLQPQLDALGTWLDENRPIAIALGVALAAVLAVLIGWPAAVLAAIVLVGVLTTKMQEWRKENEDLDDTLTAIEFTLRSLGMVIGEATRFVEDHKFAQDALLYTLKLFLTPILQVIQLVENMKNTFNRAKEVAYFLKDALYSVRDAAYAVRDAINSIPSPGDLLPSIPNPLNSLPGPLSFRASGGPAAGWTVVGEQGPELVNLPGGSHVYSNAQSMGMGPATVNVTNTFHVAGEPSETSMRKLVEVVEDAQRRAIRIAGLGGGFAYEGAFVNSGV